MKQFIFLLSVIIIFGCNSSIKKTSKIKITGFSLIKGDNIKFRGASTNFNLSFFETTIKEDGTFSVEADISEPLVLEAKVYKGRRQVLSFPCYLEPGQTLELEINEKNVLYKGSLKTLNELYKEFSVTLIRDFYRYYNATLNDFSKIETSYQLALQQLDALSATAEIIQVFKELSRYQYEAIKISIISKSLANKNDLSDDVLKFIETKKQDHFLSAIVLGIHNFNVHLEQYFDVLQKYGETVIDFEQSINQLEWIENIYVRDRYALFLIQEPVYRNQGLDGSTRKEAEKLGAYVHMDYSKKSFEELMLFLAKSEKEFNHLLPGNPAPVFNFENVNGEMVSLDQFKGKYVLIDVWNIYCGPCIKQIPYLKKYEHELKDEPIEFISVSCDEQKEKDKWRNFVIEKEMVGHQLIMDNGRNSKFLSDYAIKGFPTFILIDPEGNMINYHFFLPERDNFLKELFKIMGKGV